MHSSHYTKYLCLKIELYQPKMEMKRNLHDHINYFNQLICQFFIATKKRYLMGAYNVIVGFTTKVLQPLIQTLLLRIDQG